MAPFLSSANGTATLESGFMLEGTVDGKTVNFWFDTGSMHAHLYRQSGDRLGLRLRLSRPQGPRWTKGRHRVELWGVSRRQWLVVGELPAFLSPRVQGQG